MQLQNLQTFVLEKLHKELPARLTYHNAQHTEEVLRRTIELGEAEGLSKSELVILDTAAILHNTGFLTTYRGHEPVSCDLARAYLPKFEHEE